MGRQLPVGSTITLVGPVEQIFHITGVAGGGGSCIAYKVEFEERDGIRHIGILKEYCPAYLDTQANIRDDEPHIDVPVEFRTSFEDGVEDFSKTYKAISNYLTQHEEAANYHPVPLGLYYGNGTAYSLSSLDYGKSYDKIKDQNLKSVLQVVRSIALAVSQYHDAGFLHLDIKPENVLILDGVTELIKLFDYDSLTRIEQIRRREIQYIPQPGAYYVPELDDGNVRAIGEQTDFFEIGALLFLRLFGRGPEPYEMESGAVYPWDDAPLLVGVSPMARFELERLLSHCLQVSVRKRYASDKDLLAQIEKVSSLVNDNPPYLLDLPKWQPSTYFQGRESELKDVREHLLRDGYVFIRGMGGIGKSEITKLYAKRYSADYHTVQFCKYTDSLQVMTASIPIHGINDTDYEDLSSLANEKKKILHQCDCHTLLIVDNFNVTYDNYLREFLPASAAGFHVIFTTRCELAAEYYAPMTLKIGAMPQEDCLALFQRHYGKKLDSQETQKAIALIERIERNTLIMLLMAKAMKRTGFGPEQMLDQIEAQTTDQIRPEIFLEYDYSNEETEAYNRLYGHLNTVYSVSALNSEEKVALKCATLISPNGLPLEMFKTVSAEDASISESIVRLQALGWVEIDEKETVTVHQMVSDILASKPELRKQTIYESLFEAILDRCDISGELHFSNAIEQLSDAIQLNRRCIDVCVEDQIDAKLTLGVLYSNLYQAKDARKLLREAEAISRGEDNLYLPYIQLRQGVLEGRFGRREDAVALLEQAILNSQADVELHKENALEAMQQLAELCAENNENEEALLAYDRAISFATENGLTELLEDVFSACAELCKELDDPRLLSYYHSLALSLGIIDTFQQEESFIVSLEQGKIRNSQREYASLLSECRELYGEESPIYQDAERWRWMLSALSGDKEQAFRELSSTNEFVERYYGSDSIEMAELLSLVGRYFPEIGEFEYALDASERAVSLLEKHHSTEKYAYVRAKLAQVNVHLLLGQLSEAERIVDSVPFDRFDGATYLADLIRTAGPLLCELSRYDEAQTLCERILVRSNADPVTRAFALTISATCFEQQGNIAQAEELAGRINMDEISEYDIEKLKWTWLVMYHRLLSRLAFRKGNYPEAIRYLENLLDFATDSDAIELYRVYAELGFFRGRLGLADQAEEAFAKSAEILEKCKLAPDAICQLYNNIAVFYTDMKNPKRAKEYLDKLKVQCPQVLQPKSYLDALICHNIAWNAVELGDYQAAEPLLELSLSAMRNLGLEKTLDYWNALRNLGLFYIQVGNLNAAIQTYQELISGLKKLPEDIETPIRLKAVNECVALLYQDGQEDDARNCILESAYWFNNLYANDRAELLEFLLRMTGQSIEYGDGFTAKWLLGHAETLFTIDRFHGTPYEARFKNYMGVYHADAEQNYREALACFQEAAAIFEAADDTENEIYPVVCTNIQYAKQKLIESEGL